MGMWKVNSLLKHADLFPFLVFLLPRNVQQQTIWFSKVIECQAFTFVFQWLLSLPFLYWVPSHWLPINTNTEPQTCRHAWNTTHTPYRLCQGLGQPQSADIKLTQYNEQSIQNHKSLLYPSKTPQAYFLFLSCSYVKLRNLLYLLGFFLSLFFASSGSQDLYIFTQFQKFCEKIPPCST